MCRFRRPVASVAIYPDEPSVIATIVAVTSAAGKVADAGLDSAASAGPALSQDMVEAARRVLDVPL